MNKIYFCSIFNEPFVKIQIGCCDDGSVGKYQDNNGELLKQTHHDGEYCQAFANLPPTKVETCENTNGHSEDDHLTSRIKIESDLLETKLLNKMNRKLGIKKTVFSNDTKNIPKNFGKAIISFIQKNQQVIGECLAKYNIEMSSMLSQLKQRKKWLHSIKQLRSLWIQQEFIYAKAFREISYNFLRKGVYRYIFKSRIMDYNSHLKYRRRIMEGIRNPNKFNWIKM